MGNLNFQFRLLNARRNQPLAAGMIAMVVLWLLGVFRLDAD
jgi:hypothetical protein